MSDSIRAALKRLVELEDADLLCPSNPPETDWGAVVDAIAAARAALAEQQGGASTHRHDRIPLNPAYEITGEEIAEGAQLVDGEWWNPVMGCDSLQVVVDNARAALAADGGLSAKEIEAQDAFTQMRDEMCNLPVTEYTTRVLGIIDNHTPEWV